MSSATALLRKTCPRCGASFELDAAFCPTDGARLEPESVAPPPPSDAYIGTVIHGDIEIRSVAGVGAMGRVYRAHQRGIERDVAVKILHRELSGNASLVQRFHREAKIASKLQHPHVVEVYLAGQLPDGALYIAMEYLDGMSLAAALGASGGAFSVERALPIALQICDAVGEGHARGIVHRDLKPENVMLVRRAELDDWVKVLDFGIAKVSLGDQSMETAAGLIFGTARYISPEGAQGAKVGPPGDVYSIAVILYQMLAGRTPFDAEQPVGLLIKHIHEAPPDLRSWPRARDVPEPVARVVMDNLAKDPERRAPSARALGSALAAAAKEANVSFSDVGVVARMSVVDVAARRTIEPTLDDAAAQRASQVHALAPTEAVEARVISSPPGPTTTASNTSIQGHDAPVGRDSRRSPVLAIVLAFLLGGALVGLGMQQLAIRRDVEHDAYVAKVRRALAEGRYVDPPGDNVRELVARGLERWPQDEQLPSIRSDAAHELVTRAMAARSAGDLSLARDYAKEALTLDPTDGAARILLDRYQDELQLLASDGGTLSGPTVEFELPLGRARIGAGLELSALVRVGGSAPPGAVNNPRFTISGPSLPSQGAVLPATPGEAGAFSATFTPPRDGRYDVVFEGNFSPRPVVTTRA